MTEKLKREAEKLFIEAINAGKLGRVRRHLEERVEVDCLDSTGMTPLQHAGYKGDIQICRLLIDHGANVNDNHHHHGYTALMFAALSGNKQVVRFLLEKGAYVSIVNSVKRTAAQMASFVGRQEIASIINNFIESEELERYCNIKGKDGKALLSRQLLTPLHQYTLTYNFNAVHLAFILKARRELVEGRAAVSRVLEEVVEGLMKSKQTDEVAAMKLHYLSSFLQQTASFMRLGAVKAAGGDGGEDDYDAAINKWLKYLVKRKSPLDNPPPNQELVIRKSLLSFPFHQSQLFQQIVSTVSLHGKKENVDKCNKNDGIGDISAMTCLFNALNGQRLKHEEEDKQCASCDELDGKACNVCRSVYYCNRDCQKLHWSVHKVDCAQLKERKDRMDRLKKEEDEKKKEENPESSTGKGVVVEKVVAEERDNEDDEKKDIDEKKGIVIESQKDNITDLQNETLIDHVKISQGIKTQKDHSEKSQEKMIDIDKLTSEMDVNVNITGGNKDSC